MIMQRTLAHEVEIQGIGLLSGVNVNLKIKPAPADTGIVFVRIDLPNAPTIPATADNVTSVLRATTIERAGVKVFTIEHLMSALNISGIDNCFVELDSEEPPVLDGNSLGFFKNITAAGFVEQNKQRNIIQLEKVYRADSNDGNFVIALPYHALRVSFTSRNPHLGLQFQDFLITPPLYESEIAPARTIAYEKEIEQLLQMGLGLGGSIHNVIVYNDDGWLNPLNFPDELVRHKILDLLGDIRLAGFLNAHLIAFNSSHALNTSLAKKIFADFSF